MRYWYPIAGKYYMTISFSMSINFNVNSLKVITKRVINNDERKLKSCATKVMMQIACKLGAEPWRVMVPKMVRKYKLDFGLNYVYIYNLWFTVS